MKHILQCLNSPFELIIRVWMKSCAKDNLVPKACKLDQNLEVNLGSRSETMDTVPYKLKKIHPHIVYPIFQEKK